MQERPLQTRENFFTILFVLLIMTTYSYSYHTHINTFCGPKVNVPSDIEVKFLQFTWVVIDWI